MKKTIFFLFLILGAYCYRLEIERCYFDYSLVPREKTGFRLLILHRQGLGEKESAERIKTAASRLGWECYSVSSRVSYWKNLALFRPLERAITAVKPDLTLNFQAAEKYASGINFVSLSSGIQTYQGNWERYAHFDGFLPTFREIDFLKKRSNRLASRSTGCAGFLPPQALPSHSFNPSCGSFTAGPTGTGLGEAQSIRNSSLISTSETIFLSTGQKTPGSTPPFLSRHAPPSMAKASSSLCKLPELSSSSILKRTSRATPQQPGSSKPQPRAASSSPTAIRL